jgi:hypothetical protein
VLLVENRGARTVRMMIVNRMIARAKSMNGSSYRKISRLNRGRKKMSHGGLKCSIPKNPAAITDVVPWPWLLLRDGVVPARMEGIASADALRAHPRSAKQAVLLDGLVRVDRAGR